MVVVLEVTAVDIVYMNVFYQKSWSEELGGAIKTNFSIENESSNKY